MESDGSPFDPERSIEQAALQAAAEVARTEVRCDVATLNKLLPHKSLVVTRLHERAAFTERVHDPEDGTVEQDPGQREPRDTDPVILRRSGNSISGFPNGRSAY